MSSTGDVERHQDDDEDKEEWIMLRDVSSNLGAMQTAQLSHAEGGK